MKTPLIVDGRSLQDPEYSHRGVGQHIRALLKYPRGKAMAEDLHLVVVLDRSLPPLTADDRALFDESRMTAYRPSAERSIVLSPSPMTHSPLPFARLLMMDRVVPVAIVHDFIPYDAPQQYLTCPDRRLQYATCLTWLKRYAHYFPNSHSTSMRLQELLRVPKERCTVTGVSVRDSLLPVNGTVGQPTGQYMLVVGGGDPRKNPEVAITAHGSSQRLAAAGVRLLIAGAYPEFMERTLRDLHQQVGGRVDLLEFLPKISDEELRSLYAGALCTIAPSRLEGFSIPIVEASANGCPVLASNCRAQAELLSDPEDLFDPDDSVTLRRRMEQVALDPNQRNTARVRQSDTWRRFTENEVGRRLWEKLLEITPPEASVPGILTPEPPARNAPAIVRHNRPRVAFLTPLPPAPSGVADYSFATLGPLAARADVEVFSDTPDPRVPEGVQYAGKVDALAYLHPRFDAVVSVIGNSHFHKREFDLLLRYGAAAIAHDARMLGFYRILLGEDRALAAASDELGRPVPAAELDSWLGDEGRLEALFLKEIAQAANPIIVHSPVTARYIAERYGIGGVHLPFVPYRQFAADELGRDARTDARRRLGIPDDRLIIVSFGHVHRSKAAEDCLWVLEMLRAWKFNAHLVFVGECGADTAQSLQEIARRIRVDGSVTLFDKPIEEHEYRSWLIAADVGVQMRTYQLGGLSGAVLDCMVAALPTVANAHLADACEAPSYVRRVPDGISSVLVAEAVADIVREGLHRDRPIAERDAALADRTFDVYADRLLAALSVY